MRQRPPFDIAIVGDGFCSLMTAAHVIRQQQTKIRIAVIGKKDRWGAGVAYGLCADYHLLNVPAGRMGAFAGQPGDFLAWIKNNIPPEDQAPFIHSSRGLENALDNDFVPRTWYGRYLETVAKSAEEDALRQQITLEFIEHRAENLDYQGGIFTLQCSDERIEARQVVLAIGVPPPVVAADDPHAWMINPFDQNAPFDYSTLRHETRPVVILGLGLTMIDIVMSLFRHQYQGTIYALSRRGLLPLSHAAHENPDAIKTIAEKLIPMRGTVSQKMHILRANAALCRAHGIEWPWYMDYVRTQVPQLWAEFDIGEKKLFLKRALAYWNIHRHRQPPESHHLLDTLQSSGRLKLSKGRIQWRAKNDMLSAILPGGETINDIAAVFNARGPDYACARNSFLQSALNAKLIELHPTGLGVITNKDHSAQGKATGVLYVTGGLMVGMYLDSTSVPELRAQCEVIARALTQ
jgi:uncharacterized NAD(P)/FAD-binding protein YdhS